MTFQDHTFSFPNFTSQNPLFPGQVSIANFTFVGGYHPEPAYSVVVYGAFQGGEPFAYVETVQLSA
jgi:hypothetical protein